METHRSEAEEDPYRLYAIVRGDLQMPSGKMSTQSGHAFVNAFVKSQEIRPEVTKFYQRGGIGTKVTLEAKNQDQLLAAYQAAQEAGIPCDLIIDQHHVLPPHFDGSPIITALGLGPARREEIRHITKRFRLCN